MTLLAPLGLLAAALAIPVLLLHVLTPRRDPVRVSSLLLWRRKDATIKALAPWQRLRFSTLLLLQLLAVAILAAGLAGLAALREAPLADHTVFIVDSSGSMASVDGTPDRLTTAVARAEELYDELPDDGLASLVVAGPSPEVLLERSSDRGEFDRALRAIEATAAAADFESAFLLADGLVDPDRANGFVLLTDGGVDEGAQAQAPLGTRAELVGQSETNRAVVGLAARRLEDGLLARVTVANTGGPSATQQLRLVVDGETIERQELTLPEGEVVEREFSLPLGDRVSVFLEGDDLLAVDNQRYVVVPEAEELKVAVVGERSFFVDELLEAMSAELVEVGPAGPAAEDDDIDVILFNQVDVPDTVSRPFLAIRPPSGAPGISVVGAVEDPIPSFVRDDPLMESVDISRMAFAEVQGLEVSDGETLMAAAGAPLLVRGSTGDVPFFYFPFALERSNLPVEVAFPVLGSRMVNELITVEGLTSGYIVGERLPESFTGTLISPRGVEQTLSANFGAPALDQAGFWTAVSADGVETLLAVNPSSGESTLAVPDALNSLAAAPDGADGAEAVSATTTADPLVAWLIAAALAVVVVEFLLWLRSVGTTGLRGFRPAVIIRSAIVLLLLAALLNPAVSRTSDDMTTVFVLDTSASMSPQGLADAEDLIVDAIDGTDGSGPNAAAFGVVEVAESARFSHAVGSDEYLPETSDQGDESRLDRGIRLAGSSLTGPGRKRVVLVSDGRATSGDLIEEATRLARFDIPVDIMVPDIGAVPDAAVTNVISPNSAEPDTVVGISAEVQSTVAAPAMVELVDGDGDVLDTQDVDLEPGVNTVEFEVLVTEPGIARYRVRVATADDAVARNDESATAIEVTGSADVLVIEGAPGDASVITEALEANGIGFTIESTVGGLDRLRRYQSVLLVDVSADKIPADDLAALSTYVRELGRGLVVVGGQNAYGLGDYGGTALEELLPLDSSVKDAEREASVAEVLLIDTSESMGACHCSPIEGGAEGEMDFIEGEGVNKTDISRAGAARAIRVLSETDEVGVLAFNASQDWIIPLQQLPSEEAVTEGLAQLRPIGETRIAPALEEAAASLRESNKELKHIILFTDGFTPELPSSMFVGSGLTEEEIEQEREFLRQRQGVDLDDVVAQAEQLAAEGITISVVATGEGAIPELEQLAEIGNGRYYPGRDLDEIPEIFVKEARLAARSVINEGEFFPAITSVSAVTRGLDSSPPLRGYVATTAKSGAQVQLTVSEFQDPLLASWRIGLGRVTAWTSDGGDRWGADWAAWDGNPDFWANLVRETFPLTGASGLRVATRFEGEQMVVELESAEELEAGTTVTAFISGPDGETAEVDLERNEDGNYVTVHDAGDEGTYSVGISVNDSGGDGQVASGLATRSYPGEYVPGEPDREVLQALSDATGGRGFITPDQAFDTDGLVAEADEYRFRWWLLLAAALLWPLDIAARRLGLFSGLARFRRRSGQGSITAVAVPVSTGTSS